MKEVPLSENSAALGFGEKLFSGKISALVLLTGVGTRALVSVLETKWKREEIVSALGRLPLVARGPKPVRALAELGLKPSVAAPEPNTWKEVVAAVDGAKLDLKNKTVALQEYGVENPELVSALESRGAKVLKVPVYRWALPDDLKPLEAGIRALADGQAEAALFTTSVQIEHALEVARRGGLEDGFKAGLARVVVGSVGPDCSDALRRAGIRVDVEPESPKMGPLVLALAEKAPAVLAALRRQ